MQSGRFFKWTYILLLFLHLSATAQPNSLAGSRYTYRESYLNPVESYVSIGDSTLEFYHFWGCLHSEYFGRGSYYVFKDTIFMCTELEFPHKESDCKINGSIAQNDQVRIHINQHPSRAWSVSVRLENKAGRPIRSFSTDSSGNVLLDSLPPIGAGEYMISIDGRFKDVNISLDEVRENLWK